MKKEYSAFIFARGGSKGIKNKNIKMVGGIPLIAHAIRCGLESKAIKQVIVSTDSDEIAKISKEFGAQALIRPKDLASDTSPELLSWKHAIENRDDVFVDREKSLFISLPATSPLRASIDVDRAVEKFLKGGCDIVFGITPSQRNPYLNMVTVGEDDLIHLVIDGLQVYRRQDVPEVFDITTCVYVSNPKYILSCSRLMDGKVGYVNIPNKRSIDIDNEYELYLADLMLKYPFSPKEP